MTQGAFEEALEAAEEAAASAEAVDGIREGMQQQAATLGHLQQQLKQSQQQQVRTATASTVAAVC